MVASPLTYKTVSSAIDAMVPGFHKKNEIEYQKDIDRFVQCVLSILLQMPVGS